MAYTTAHSTTSKDKEAEVIKNISKNNSIVISTGGGSILRKENVNFLKQNFTEGGYKDVYIPEKIDENGNIEKVMDKVKPDTNAQEILDYLLKWEPEDVAKKVYEYVDSTGHDMLFTKVNIKGKLY